MNKTFLLLISCLAMASCGVKPGGVEPPSGPADDTFPRTYPDTSTEPR